MIPVYPFQCLASDFFSYQGNHYIVAVDRYSNWPIVEEATGGAKGLISSLRRIFVTFGICEEITSDGGPEFTAKDTQTFLKNWGVRHRLSSVANPHANCRAEVAVKTTKRMIMNNTGPRGTLNTDNFLRAMLQYRNTPDRETGLSPAMCVFGRSIRDFIPIHPGRYLPHPTWRETLIAREEALRNRHFKISERLTEHTHSPPPLVVGDHVRIQNQRGNHPNKWDRTGVVVEVRQYHQYVIRVDGSGRVTLRNRKYLRKYIPVIQRDPLITSPGPTTHVTSTPTTPKEGQQPARQNDKQSVENNNNPPLIPPVEVEINTNPPTQPHEPVQPQYQPTPIQEASPPRHIPIPDQPVEPNIVKKRTPLILKQLESHNKAGLSEQPLTSPSEKRITRQSTKK